MQTTELKFLRKSLLSHTIGKILLSSYRPIVYVLGMGCLTLPLQQLSAQNIAENNVITSTVMPDTNLTKTKDVEIESNITDEEVDAAEHLMQALQNDNTPVEPVIPSDENFKTTIESIEPIATVDWEANQKAIAAMIIEPLPTVVMDDLNTSTHNNNLETSTDSTPASVDSKSSSRLSRALDWILRRDPQDQVMALQKPKTINTLVCWADNEDDQEDENLTHLKKNIQAKLFSITEESFKYFNIQAINQESQQSLLANPTIISKLSYGMSNTSCDPNYNGNFVDENSPDLGPIFKKIVMLTEEAAQAVGYYQAEMQYAKVDDNTLLVRVKPHQPIIVKDQQIKFKFEEVSATATNAQLQQAARAESMFSTIAIAPDLGLDDTFHHGKYEATKKRITKAATDLGHFDGFWQEHDVFITDVDETELKYLKSVDTEKNPTLETNSAYIDLDYNVGTRYKFQKQPVQFRMIGKKRQFPLKDSVLNSLIPFKGGAYYDVRDVNEFISNLTNSRYFNYTLVNVLKPESKEKPVSTADVKTTDLEENENTVDISATQDLSEDLNVDSNIATQAIAANQVSDPKNTVVDEIKQPMELPHYAIFDHALDFTGVVAQQHADQVKIISQQIITETQAAKSASNTALLRFNETRLNPQYYALNIPYLVESVRLQSEDIAHKHIAFAAKEIPIVVLLNADQLNNVEAGIGYGTDTGVRLRSQYRRAIVNENGHSFDANVELSEIRQSFDARYTIPVKNLNPVNDYYRLVGGYENEVRGKIGRGIELNVEAAILGAERIKKRPMDQWQQTYSVRYRLDRINSKGNIDPNDLPDAFKLVHSSPEQESLLWGYEASKFFQSSTRPLEDKGPALNPTQGFRQFYRLEVGSESLLTETDLAILNAGWRFIYSLGDNADHQFVGRGDLGYILTDNFDQVPYNLRYFAGGDQSIRGFDYKSLSPRQDQLLIGGQAYAVGSLEYNYQFKEGWRGAIFTDVGNAYDKEFTNDTKYSLGLGLRLATAVGPIRIDVAAGVSEESVPIRLHFFIGPALQQ